MPKLTQVRASDDVVAPARIDADMVQDRHFRNDQGQISQRRGYRRLTPLECVRLKGQLAGGSPKYTEANRFTAGTDYGVIYATAEASGRDSTQNLNSGGGGGQGGASLSTAKAEAIRKRAAIHKRMGVRDKRIVEMVCALGFWPSEAVRDVLGEDYTKSVIPRFREAMDVLVEAMDSAQKNGWRV